LLNRLKDVGLYVTLFAIGHSATLIVGVLTGVSASANLIDAIIGLSVVYKALDNLGAFPAWLGVQPNAKAAILVFGAGNQKPRRVDKQVSESGRRRTPRRRRDQ